MVVERFKAGRVRDVYARFAEKGRMMPEGVRYIDSWITADVGRCFQLMEADSRELLDRWAANWADLVEFEVVPIISSDEARRAVLGS